MMGRQVDLLKDPGDDGDDDGCGFDGYGCDITPLLHVLRDCGCGFCDYHYDNYLYEPYPKIGTFYLFSLFIKFKITFKMTLQICS